MLGMHMQARVLLVALAAVCVCLLGAQQTATRGAELEQASRLRTLLSARARTLQRHKVLSMLRARGGTVELTNSVCDNDNNAGHDDDGGTDDGDDTCNNGDDNKQYSVVVYYKDSSGGEVSYLMQDGSGSYCGESCFYEWWSTDEDQINQSLNSKKKTKCAKAESESKMRVTFRGAYLNGQCVPCMNTKEVDEKDVDIDHLNLDNCDWTDSVFDAGIEKWGKTAINIAL